MLLPLLLYTSLYFFVTAQNYTCLSERAYDVATLYYVDDKSKVVTVQATRCYLDAYYDIDSNRVFLVQTYGETESQTKSQSETSDVSIE
ncbi:hypothetical protein OESDEN_15337 [Oesophagostomum dentatum]|uniref:Secreted protein n=1 Tax=Oesophagostomum dentatum TaxID=61180 RepID=A0A0B1SHX4_OESDE|nr:hypothetical protein OESDEN_15337 [Oesophagostomum dentatum]